jgi:hypothetical protein
MKLSASLNRGYGSEVIRRVPSQKIPEKIKSQSSDNGGNSMRRWKKIRGKKKFSNILVDDATQIIFFAILIASAQASRLSRLALCPSSSDLPPTND